MNNKFVYTPGPTETRENVRLARAKTTTNPDIDIEFVEFYKKTTEKIGKIINTKNPVYILSGEGILGLEAACASLTEPKDRVLVIDNGIFGKGFGEFVEMYGGQVVYYSKEYTKEIDIDQLKEFLEQDSDFKYATVVHCDTPTGILNDISKICPLLNEYGILTVVDSVAAMVGEEIRVDDFKIDIALGGSQKAFSAPTGLTIVSVSEAAKKAIDSRTTKVIGFYCNLKIWENYYEEKWFPYTMPISDIIGLDVAVDNILEEGIEDVLKRHQNVANATRKAVVEYGLELFSENGYSNTVTVVKIPRSIGALKVKDYILEKYDGIITTSLKPYTDEVIRIGHMGENARDCKTLYALTLIGNSLKELGFESDMDLGSLFSKYIRINNK